MGSAATMRSEKRNWGQAVRAMRALLADPNDTVQVFRVMQALNAGNAGRNYRKLLTTPQGGRIAYQRQELVTRLMDRDWLAQFAPGTVGAAYRDFLARTGYSADGLAAVSNEVRQAGEVEEHPHAWFGRRERDLHDIWHVLTGYQADDPLGELCLVAFSYAQTKGLGWGFIAVSGVLKNLRERSGRIVAKAVWEGWRRGRKAAWLHGEDIEALMAENLDAARARLRIAPAVRYQAAQAAIMGPGELAAA